MLSLTDPSRQGEAVAGYVTFIPVSIISLAKGFSSVKSSGLKGIASIFELIERVIFRILFLSKNLIPSKSSDINAISISLNSV